MSLCVNIDLLNDESFGILIEKSHYIYWIYDSNKYEIIDDLSTFFYKKALILTTKSYLYTSKYGRINN